MSDYSEPSQPSYYEKEQPNTSDEEFIEKDCETSDQDYVENSKSELSEDYIEVSDNEIE
jgi:hypothetical protein